MKKILAFLVLSLLFVSNFSTLAQANQGTRFQSVYETFYDAGMGMGSRFQINAINLEDTQATGSSAFAEASILADVGSDGTVGPSEECNAGETIACTSFSSDGWTTGTAVCARNDHWDTSPCSILSIPPDSPGGSPGSSVPFLAVCGNGIQESSEQCDDGNKINGDGCSSTCSIEHMAAKEEPEEEGISQICGNNILEEGEQCDDGNTINKDGCDSICKLETEEEKEIVIVKIDTKKIIDKIKTTDTSYQLTDSVLSHLSSLTCEEVGCISKCPDTLSPSLRFALNQPLFGECKNCDNFIYLIKIKHLLDLLILLIIIIIALMGKKIYDLSSHKKKK